MRTRLHRDEEGVAIITAVLTSAIVVLLGTTVVQLALHNSEGSAYDRRRVQAIGAAEAGLDYYMSHLTATGGQVLPCAVNKPMVGSPGRFEVSPTFYTATGPGCPPDGTPTAVLIRSTGYAGPAGSELDRTMEAYARLTISTGGTFDNAGAIVAQNNVNFTSNATIGGSNFSDADVYTNGNVTLASNSTLYGRILAQGGVTMGSNAEVKKDVWAKGAISLSSGATIRGAATAGDMPPASPVNITLANNARIYGTATASGSITGGLPGGTRKANQLTVAPPPARPYPTFTYTQSDWTNQQAGYAPQIFTGPGPAACSSAESFIKNTWTGGSLLVRVASTCLLTFTNHPYTVRGNLAIISDGPITFNTGARFSTVAGATANVFLIAGLSGVAPCNLTMRTNSGFGPGTSTLIYTPATCTADISSNTAIAEGQILAGTINFHHTAQYSYKRLTVPGTGAGGFKQDVMYKREIIA